MSKKQSDNINQKIALVIKSGKYTFGYKQTLKLLRQGNAQLVLISNNCPGLRQTEVEYYAMLSKAHVYHFDGNNNELGIACGRFHRVGIFTITNPGDSDILDSLKH